ncbi:SWI/SNF complex component snf12 [Entophlyctis sp. JEL0112]|nr:SWI/SNF complex component snf12 [Entophlyctis sp. JEL0112]
MSRPTLFEVTATQTLVDLVKPAVRYCAAWYGQQNAPLALSVARIVSTWFDEVFLCMQLVLEAVHVFGAGGLLSSAPVGSMAERFYGLKRVQAASGIKTSSNANPTTRARLGILAALVIAPYMRDKMLEFAERWEGSDHGNRMRRFLAKVFRWLDVTILTAKLILSATFMHEARWANSCSIVDLMLGLRIVRMEPDDYKSLESIQKLPWIPKASGKSPLLQATAIASSIANKSVAFAASFVVPSSIFLFRFVDWWYAAEYHKLAQNQEPIPPPPLCLLVIFVYEGKEIIPVNPCLFPTIKPHPSGVPLPADPSMCPLCQKALTNPAMLASGFVFCYPCVYKYVEAHGLCPVTRKAVARGGAGPQHQAFRSTPQMTPQQIQQMQQMMMASANGAPRSLNIPAMGVPAMNMMGMNVPVGAVGPQGLPQNSGKRPGMQMGPQDQKRRKVFPMDRSLPPKIESFVPEAKLYAQLQHLEHKFDAAIAAKRAELLESVMRTPKHKRILRLFVENTASNQKPANSSDSLNLDVDASPSWTLKLHGVLVSPSGATEPAVLSSLFKSVQVKLIRDAALYSDGGNTIEWRKNELQSQHFEGIEITKKGDMEVPVKISIVLESMAEKYKISDELSDLLDIRMDTKMNVVMRLWQYIKVEIHGLQDIDDKRTINFDETLNKIFKTKKVLLTHLPDLLASHFHAVEPLTIDYTIKLDKDRTVSETAYELDVEVEDAEIKRKIVNVVSGGDPTALAEISQIDDEITKLVQKVSQQKHKREFMLSFAKDPVGFINSWLVSQTRDLEVILGDSRINSEEARRCSMYKDNWVNEAVFRYLNSI